MTDNTFNGTKLNAADRKNGDFLAGRKKHLAGRLLPFVQGYRLYLSIGAMILLVSGIMIVGGVYYVQELRRAIAVENAQNFLKSMVALHKYYSKVVVPKAKAAGADFSINYLREPDKIPFPATLANDFGIALQKQQKSLYSNVYSDFPFMWNRERVLDEFEKTSLLALQQDPGTTVVRFEQTEDGERVRLAVGMTLTRDCIGCHNDPKFNNNRRVWQIGELRGARQVALPVPNDPIPQHLVIGWGMAIALMAALFGGLLVMPNVRSLRSALDDNSELSDQLRATNLSLHDANRKKSEFLAGVSHDLRTPLNAISGFSEVMKMRLYGDMGDARYNEYADHIYSSAQHLLSLINQVLDINRIESGRWEVKKEMVSAYELMDMVAPLIKGRLADGGFALEMVRPEKDFKFLADPTAIKQIIINLSDNSVKYSQGDWVIIRLREFSGIVRMEVEDNGVGVTPEQLASLKELSSRGAADHSGLPGYGIGLWLVDNLSKLHGGELKVETPENGGSCFFIAFPTDVEN